MEADLVGQGGVWRYWSLSRSLDPRNARICWRRGCFWFVVEAIDFCLGSSADAAAGGSLVGIVACWPLGRETNWSCSIKTFAIDFVDPKYPNKQYLVRKLQQVISA